MNNRWIYTAIHICKECGWSGDSPRWRSGCVALCPKCGASALTDRYREGTLLVWDETEEMEWMCEEHVGVPWPHGDCMGPGMPFGRFWGVLGTWDESPML